MRAALMAYLGNAPSGSLSTIPVLVSVLYDPDGYFVELNELLSQAAGTD